LIHSDTTTPHSQAFDFDTLSACIHCGLCLTHCPTYMELGLEMDSPRGRIYQMRTLFEDRAELTDCFVTRIYNCLGCRACETACPSGVQYGRLLDISREQIHAFAPPKGIEKLIHWAVFRHFLTHRGRMALVFRLLRLYQISGLQTLVRKLGLLKLIPGLSKREALTPDVLPFSLRKDVWKTTPAAGERKHRVALHAGCIADFTFSDVNAATVRILRHNGCEILTPNDQTCCGALHAHSGEMEQARDLARKNIDAFLQADVEYIVINAAGCGAQLREYHHLLAADDAWRDKAQQFVDKLRDVSEFLAEIEIRTDFGPLPETVTYHDACHLAHAQGIRQQPRDLIAAIPELTLVPLKDSDICCGSAGIYNVTHPDMATRLLRNKISRLKDTNAQRVIMGNPGCMIQIRQGIQEAGLPMQVEHIVLLLDRAYQAGNAYNSRQS
jgi:Fe-S oxidoreductase